MREIRERLQFLDAVGLNYLSLDRAANTLSGGESQRQYVWQRIGSKLRGVFMYWTNPRSVAPQGQLRLLATLEELRNLGNTVVVVKFLMKV